MRACVCLCVQFVCVRQGTCASEAHSQRFCPQTDRQTRERGRSCLVPPQSEDHAMDTVGCDELIEAQAWNEDGEDSRRKRKNEFSADDVHSLPRTVAEESADSKHAYSTHCVRLCVSSVANGCRVVIVWYDVSALIRPLWLFDCSSSSSSRRRTRIRA